MVEIHVKKVSDTVNKPQLRNQKLGHKQWVGKITQTLAT